MRLTEHCTCGGSITVEADNNPAAPAHSLGERNLAEATYLAWVRRHRKCTEYARECKALAATRT